MVNIGIKLYDNTIHHIGDIASIDGAETTITTIVDYQKKAEVEVLVSEPSVSEEYCPVGRLLIQNLPPAKAGEPRIKLKFYLDADYSLTIDILSKDVLKQQLKINKTNWEPVVERIKESKKKGNKEKGPLYTISISPEDYEDQEEDESSLTETAIKYEDDDKILNKKSRDIVIPILIGLSLLVLVIFAVYFFWVIRPWDTSGRVAVEPTRPEATQETFVSDVTSSAISDMESESETVTSVLEVSETSENDTAMTQDEEIKTVKIDINKINSTLKNIGPVYFNPNSAKMKDSSELKKCDKIAQSVMEYKKDILLIINGHTAKAGTEKEREELSIERAQTVMQELIKRGAITESACRIEGYGSEKPVTTDTEKMSFNRRVELSVELLK